MSKCRVMGILGDSEPASTIPIAVKVNLSSFAGVFGARLTL